MNIPNLTQFIDDISATWYDRADMIKICISILHECLNPSNFEKVFVLEDFQQLGSYTMDELVTVLPYIIGENGWLDTYVIDPLTNNITKLVEGTDIDALDMLSQLAFKLSSKWSE